MGLSCVLALCVDNILLIRGTSIANLSCYMYQLQISRGHIILSSCCLNQVNFDHSLQLTLKLEESELEHALQDKLLITSVLEHGIPS